MASSHPQGPLNIAERTRNCLKEIKKSNGWATVLILLGRTGAGKSCLLEDITGAEGHSEIDYHEIETENVHLEEVSLEGKQYFIMDTPGFDEGREVETFNTIVNVIQECWAGTRTWGILYVTNIGASFSRSQTVDLKLINFIGCFCGEGFYPNITFVSTHWGDEIKVKTNNRYETRRKGPWNVFLRGGAREYQHGRQYTHGVITPNVMSWDNYRSQVAQCARDIISRYYGLAHPRIPTIVQELNQGVLPGSTTAGAFLGISEEPNRSFSGDFQTHSNDRPSGPQTTPQTNTSSWSGESTWEPGSSTGLSQAQGEPSNLNLADFINRVEIHMTGPIFSISNGKLRINALQAGASLLSLLSPTPSDPSIVNFLVAHNFASDMASRMEYASAFGLDPSTIGTSEGNTALLRAFRSFLS